MGQPERLIVIQSDKVPVEGSWRTEFAYDGQSRSVGMVEKMHGTSRWTTESIARYLWEGTEIIQKRDLTGSTVTAKYFDQGEIRVFGFGAHTVTTYYTRDHLGSVREAVNQGGVIAQSFDYTAWGERTSPTAGSLEWGFTGHHYHEKSGLCLAMYRAYDAILGRWLSEDPIGEAGGLNLYGYGPNSPVAGWDPFGADWHHLVPFASGLDAGLSPDFINGADNGLDMTKEAHDALHKAKWTEHWKDWFDECPKHRTVEAAKAHLEDLKKDSDFKDLLKGDSVKGPYKDDWNRMKQRYDTGTGSPAFRNMMQRRIAARAVGRAALTAAKIANCAAKLPLTTIELSFYQLQAVSPLSYGGYRDPI